ncbi:MAG TPA: septation ring formation regulator EzrA [Candidatus Faecimonas intestinavium]|jgi:septation ring formation regulator|nr:septation ring formation regulator EzrA [Bacilli bacterium]HIT23508.1 septation ring formation regulator EzrA [Candidatus Faecimonas intestinavium]
MQGQYLIIGSYLVVCIIIVIVVLHILRKKVANKYRSKVRELEVAKNMVASTPVSLELSKVEPIIKNDKMEEKYNDWQDRFDQLRETRLSQIDDMLIDLDIYIDKKDYKNCVYRLAKTELEIYRVRESADSLLDEIKEITLSEEKYRSIVIKLKTKYRELNKEFQDHRQMYDEMQEAVELQLENIERRFLDFEKVMEKNQYSEVVHIVKALDTMIEHMGIVIKEIPDLLLMAKQVIPNRMKEVKELNEDMVQKGYPLDYLNVPYNLEESQKNIDHILDKVRVLNLEDCMFELKTMLDYYDSLFVDFEKERLSRKAYIEMEADFSKKLEKTNKVVQEVYNQLDDIKNMYDLNDQDVETIHDVNKILVVINDDYKKMLAKVEAKSSPYSMLQKEVEELTIRLKEMEDDLDQALKSLGNMYDDEVRAREQLEEIESFLKQSKEKMRGYKLPIITNNYFVQLSEANEAIEEVIKELERKPIVIKTLNTRVDTARDLVLKLYNTTNEMIKTAQLAEMAIVFGNRYRSVYDDVDSGLDDAEKLFFKGEYKKALDISIKAVSLVDENIYRKLLAVYDK